MSVGASENTVDTQPVVTTLYDTQQQKDVQISAEEISTAWSFRGIETKYSVTTDGSLDYTVTVNLPEDRAYIDYANGNHEVYIISETVTVEKLPDSHTQATVTSAPVPVTNALATPTAYDTNYITNEPFEIDSQGNQVDLGTIVYYGYESVGYLSYSNPDETGYLQRRKAGYTTFDAYKFTISAGTLFGAAVGIVVSLLTGGGVSILSSVVSALLSSVTGAIAGSVIDTLVAGTLQCREYKWLYRVRHNSNHGPIVYTTERYRYWWEMYDQRGNRAFEFRNDMYDGFLLSNYELMGAALGRW